MEYTREFVQMQSCDFQVKFFNTLSKFWDEFHLLIWKCNKEFSKLRGSEIKKFIINCPKVAKVIRDNFVMTEDIEYLCQGLELWYDLESFLKISTVKDESSFPSLINNFKTNLSKFYKCGKFTFLTKRNYGDDETFYFHCLRFYIPNIVDQTWEKHGLGVGIFTMQGYERRNKESKNTLRRFNNNKGNIVIGNMKRLWDLFYYEHPNM